MATNSVLRIARLRALIEHPRTSTNERVAAQRMLDRVFDNARQATHPGRSYGLKHANIGRHAGLPRIVEMIREDIVLVRTLSTTAPGGGDVVIWNPIGGAPSGISYEVDTPSYGEIVITISSVPREWGWNNEGGITRVSPSLQALADELAAIMNGYNHDGVDIAKRFFGRVRVDGEALTW